MINVSRNDSEESHLIELMDRNRPVLCCLFSGEKYYFKLFLFNYPPMGIFLHVCVISLHTTFVKEKKKKKNVVYLTLGKRGAKLESTAGL